MSNENYQADGDERTDFEFGRWVSHPNSGDEVVITGMSGKFPDSRNIQEYQDNLVTKQDMISGDDRRWYLPDHPEIPQRGGKIYDLDKFDAGYFGIHYRQSHIMDPTLRVWLETAIESIVDAGVNPVNLAGTKTGVFIGACNSDMENETFSTVNQSQSFVVTGYIRSMLARRLSYYLKLKGPSYIIDTACSSSLNALDHAFKAIRNGECDNAIVGGARLTIHPGLTLQFFRLGVLSRDGRCKVFDEDADGYARSETIACVFLQRSKCAKRVYGEIVYSKINCDGFKSSGITFPSIEAQKQLMEEVYEDCNINPSELTYLEVHGTGTKVGDPQEIEAVDLAIAQKRKEPLLIGSVKSNIGHTEGSSGVCSVIKVLLAMQNRSVQPNINLKKLRKGLVGIESGRLKVATENTPLEDKNLLIGVNNFGFGGNNCHVVIREFKCNNNFHMDETPRLVCVSSRTKEGVISLLNDLSKKDINDNYIGLLHNIFQTADFSHLYRGFAILSKGKPAIISTKLYKANFPPLCIFFGDIQRQFKKIATYMRNFSEFEKSLLRVTKILIPLGVDVAQIFSKQNTTKAEDQLGSIVVQIGITDLIKLLEIKPEHLFGNLLTKFVCAYFDDILTLEEAILASYQLIQRKDNDISSTDTDLTWHKLKKYNYLENICDISQKPLILSVTTDSLRKSDNSLQIFCSHTNTVTFLEAIGSLYEAGYQPKVHLLYSKVNYPVNSATPVISPLLKWDHHRTWYTYKFENFKITDAQQTQFYIGLADKEREYIADHVVDGRNLFPASGFLNMAWQTVAQSRRLLPTDICVKFENCRFIRAVNVPKKGFVTLMVTTQRGTGKFEILEGEHSVVTGYISVLSSNTQKPIDFKAPSNENQLEMNTADIYKEFNLRGYNYRGLFKGIIKSDVDASVGLINWEDNWVTFIDKMFQFKILQVDTRLLYIPTGIQEIIIDPEVHLKLVEEIKPNTAIPVYASKECNIIKAGGIQLKGLLVNAIQKRKSKVEPVLEKYEFVPNHCDLNLPDSVRVLMQIILENNLENTVRAVEFLDEFTSSDSGLLLPIIHQVLEDIPLVKSDLTISTKRDMEDIPDLKREQIVLTQNQNFVLIIGSQILKRASFLDQAIIALKEDGFILTREDKYMNPVANNSLEVLNVFTVGDEKLILLHKIKPMEDIVVVELTSDDFSWLESFKNALKAEQNVIIYSQNQPSSGVLGFVNCIRREPNGKNVKCFFIVDDAPKFDINHDFYKEQITKKMAINIYKDGKWGTYRHLPLKLITKVEAEHVYVHVGSRGNLSSIEWVQGPYSQETKLNVGEEIVYSYYTALNFKDIMTASGRISLDAISCDRLEQDNIEGFEFAGRDLSGRRVMGIVNCAALSTIVKANPDLLWNVPDHWTLEEAATVPVITDFRRAKSILIHSGTGGVGLAAIRLALHFGVEPFVTVGSEEKRIILKQLYPQLKDSNIGNSRNTSFEEMVKRGTDGRGVDFVLNSTSEELLKASVRCLARGGVFLEIGKFDISQNHQLHLLFMEKEATFHGIMLDRAIKGKKFLTILLDEIYKGIDKGYVKPLPRVVFQKEEVQEAFKYMSSGKHTGKVLVNIRPEEIETLVIPSFRLVTGIPRFHCLPTKAYIILGGLGGFGLELADWLALRGVKKLVLTSRSGIKTGYQERRIKILRNYGIQVKISLDDLTTKSGCLNLIETTVKEIGQIDGIFNLAAVLKDAYVEDQTESDFLISLGPKAYATEYLDRFSRELCPDLRYFVVFSSMSCGRGTAGQSNYGMGNSVMERICERRKQDGYPALAIQWGAIGDVGLVVNMQKDDKELQIGGTCQQKIVSCLETMDKFLALKEEAIVASMMVAQKNKDFGSGNVTDEIAHILGIEKMDTINPQSTLPELGMDSITATEIMQILESHDIYLSAKDLRTLTFAKLIEIQENKSENKLDEILKKDEFGQYMMLRFLPDKSLGDSQIVELKSSNSDALKVFIIPGIEGSLKTFQTLIEKLDIYALGVQYNYNEPEDSIEGMAESVFPAIHKNLENDCEFNLICHSFGVNVTLEVVKMLEDKGLIGRIVIIDAAPDYLMEASKHSLDLNKEDEFQVTILCGMLGALIPPELVAKNKVKLFECDNYTDRIKMAKSIIPSDLHIDEGLEEKSAIAAYKRYKASMMYKYKHEKLKSSLYLFKATQPMISNMEDDYGLHNISDKVKVDSIEGNHSSILDNPDLFEKISKILFNASEI